MLPGFSLLNEEQLLFRRASIIYMIGRGERERRLANGHRTHHHGRYAETSQGGRITYSVTISHCHRSVGDGRVKRERRRVRLHPRGENQPIRALKRMVAEPAKNVHHHASISVPDLSGLSRWCLFFRENMDPAKNEGSFRFLIVCV